MKKVLSLILCMILILPCFQNVCVAVSEQTEVAYGYIDYYSTQNADTVSGYTPKYDYAFSIGSSACTAYSQLGECEKEIYNAVVNSGFGQLVFTFKSPSVVYTTAFSSINFDAVMNAIELDHPEIFYYGGFRATKEGGKLTYEIHLPINTSTSESFFSGDIDTLVQMNKEMYEEFEKAKLKFKTRYDFVKSLHDWLCNNITYVNNYENCHNPYGALVEKEAVCQGYAETFKMYCDYYNIPCVCIKGDAVVGSSRGGHMWNAVQMDDGKWYFVDTTWDDQSVLLYDYFLIGLDSKDTHFDKEKFSENHIPDDELYIPNLNYASSQFDSSLKNSSFGATYNAYYTIYEQSLVLSFFCAEANKVYFDGIYTEIPEYATGTVFSPPSTTSGAYQEWVLVLIGDVDGNGTADASDYAAAVNKVLDSNEVVSCFDKACDANLDGTLDVLDLVVLEKAINGTDTDIVLV